MTMGIRHKLSGDEFDAFTQWRHLTKRMEKPGVTKKIKRLFSRRVRHELKMELYRDVVE